jgi:hypothetical protein
MDILGRTMDILGKTMDILGRDPEKTAPNRHAYKHLQKALKSLYLLYLI